MTDPKSGFFAITKTAAQDFFRIQGPSQSAALTFYALLTVMPLAACVAVAAGYLAGSPEEIDALAQKGLSSAFPWLESLAGTSLSDLARSVRDAAPVGLAVLILASAVFFTALRNALALPYDPPPPGGFRRMGRGILSLIAGPVLCVCLVSLLLFALALRQSGPSFESALLTRTIRQAASLWAYFGLVCLYFCLYMLLLPGRRSMGAAAMTSLVLAAASQLPAYLFAAFPGAEAFSAPAPITAAPEELLGRPAPNAAPGAFGGILFFAVWTDFVMALILFGGHFLRVWEKRRSGARPLAPRGKSGKPIPVRQVFEEDA